MIRAGAGTASDESPNGHEARLKHIFDAVLEGIVVIDSHGIITEINQSALQMFGYSSDELLGRNCSLLMPAAIKTQHDHYLSQYERTGEKHILREPRRVLARRRNGEEFPIHIAINDTRTPEARIYTAVIRDITKALQTEKALSDAKEAAEATSQLKSDFLANMSHALRTPLNAILGHAQLLGAEQNIRGTTALDTASVSEHADRIMQSGWHLLGLIEEVLDLAKVESGAEKVVLEPVPLAPLLRSCREQLQYQADKHGVNLQPTPMPELDLRVMAEPRRLRQVLMNLLSNAIKYNHVGGSVTVRVGSGGARRILIEIQDTGRGMSTEQLQQLFQPFIRFTRPDETITGSGVGLALSRRLVENMNGCIRVSSEPGKGSSFSVELDEAVPGANPPGFLRTLQQARPPSPHRLPQRAPSNPLTKPPSPRTRRTPAGLRSPRHTFCTSRTRPPISRSCICISDCKGATSSKAPRTAKPA
ncbi:MAG: PAS domain-containing sensor histidine kinase [Quisquiliibacterium sp.]